MMDKKEICEALEEIFKENFEQEIDIEKAGLGADLREDLGMSSIGLLYMAMAIEEKFGVKFSNDDFMKMKTIGDVVGKISEK